MNKYIVCLVSFLLIGCGGGSSSPKTNISTPLIDIDAAYSGLKTSAKLTPNFAKGVATDFLFFEEFTLNLLQIISPLRDERIFEKNKTDSEACQDGGKQSLSINKNVSVGTADLFFDNCRIDGTTINGSYTLHYDLVTFSSKVEIKNYKITVGQNVSVLMNGTIEEGENESIIVNLLSELDEIQLLAKNLIFDNPHEYRSSNGILPSYGGQFYYSDLGKIELSLDTRTTSYNNIPYDKFSEGALLKMEGSEGGKASFQLIDDNGYAIGSSGSNEASSILVDNPDAMVEINFSSIDEGVLYGKNNLGELLTIPSAGEKPIANEVLSAADNLLSYPNYQSIVSLKDGIQFDGRSSTDPEGALLSYNWLIIESPSGSEAKLSSENTSSPNLTVDYLGTYKVQMVVSDGVFESNPKIISIEVGSTEFNPLNRFGGISWTAKQLDGSFSEGPTFLPLTSLDIVATPNTYEIPDFLKFDIEWDLVDQPSISNINLTDSNSRNPRFIPEEAGQYTLEATVNNGFAILKDTKSIDVYDFDKSVTPRIDVFASGNQVAFIGVERTVDLRYIVDIGSNIYSSSIKLLEQPSNSNPQSNVVSDQSSLNSDTIFNFEFDQIGRYIFEIQATNGYADIAPMELVFNVYDSAKASLIEDEYSSPINSGFQEYVNIGSMEMEDINSDSYNDLIIAYSNNFGDKYQVLSGKSDNTFTDSGLFDAPSDQIIDLSDINNDSGLELVFRGNENSFDDNNSTIHIIPLTNGDIDFDDPDSLPLGDMSISFDLSYYVDSLSDINKDGLKDVILLKKPDINNFSFEGLAYSLQLEGNRFSAPIVIPTTNKYTLKVSHDELNNSLLVVSDDTGDNIYEGLKSKVHVDEFKYEQTDLRLESTNIINYSRSTPFGTNLSINKIIDFDGDGIKEILGTSKIAGFLSTAIWEKSSINNSYEKSQSISFRNRGNEIFVDMDSDGNIDIVENNRILYQDDTKQFEITKEIELDTSSSRNLLPYVFDIDNDGDFDMITIFRIYFEDIVPNIKILRNTSN